MNLEKTSTILRPETISLFKKRRFLLSLSEDDFRDQLIRPLFLRQGLKDGRDVCGPMEEGKDAIFIVDAPLGLKDIYVVQTKRGSLNLSKTTSRNVTEATTQLKTAMGTLITFVSTREKCLPSKAFLCASGEINNRAKDYILSAVAEPNIRFMDRDDLIPLVDTNYPEFWLGIEADSFPYFRNLRKAIEDSDDSAAISDILSLGKTISPSTDSVFVTLFLHRATFRTIKFKGQFTKIPHFEELPVTGVIDRKESLLLITGDAGSGKSTSLQRIAYEVAGSSMSTDMGMRIPVLLRARDIEQSLLDCCMATTSHLSLSGKPAFSNSDLIKGKLIILIDALDELPNDGKRDELVAKIRTFNAAYPKSQVIVTSREIPFIRDSHHFNGFVSYKLSPFNLTQAKQLVNRVQKGKSLSPEMKHELIRRLQEVHGMELNPLLVTVLIATSDFARKDIPANITELFKKFTEVMLGRWDSSKGLREQFHGPLKDHILKKLAFDMHQRHASSISLKDAKCFIENELSIIGQTVDVEAILSETIYRSGLFRITEEHIEFRHLLLQEFFAGRAIPSSDYVRTVIADQWWQGAIVFYFGEHPGDSKALQENTIYLLTLSSKSLFQGAIALGLALQACYLVPVSERITFLRRIIEALAHSGNGMLAPETSASPMSLFIAYYLYGRDAVSMDILKDKIDELVHSWDGETSSVDTRDLRQYWLIVGLIESGHVDSAESVIKDFRPADARLLLAIHLGCFLVSHYRITTKEEKKTAERICAHLEPKINHLRQELMKEFHSQLLEVQRGEIKELPFIEIKGEGN